jgi:hypothetical protein
VGAESNFNVYLFKSKQDTDEETMILDLLVDSKQRDFG